MTDKLPDWAVEMGVLQADQLADTLLDESRVPIITRETRGIIAQHFARAFVSAERRGIERAAKFHEDQADQFEKAAFQELSVSRKLRYDAAASQHRDIATAIRQRGAEE